MHNAILGQLSAGAEALDLVLCRLSPKVDVTRLSLDAMGHLAQFVGSLGQRHLPLDVGEVHGSSPRRDTRRPAALGAVLSGHSFRARLGAALLLAGVLGPLRMLLGQRPSL